MNTNKIVILGLGNIILSDDGIGTRLVNEMESWPRNAEIDFKTGELGGFEIIDHLKNYKMAVIIDGIRTKDGDPGNVYFMNAEDYMETLHLSNFHDMTFSIALEYAAKLGIEMPDVIKIIAIEIEEDTLFMDGLTPVLQSKYKDILQVIRNFIFSEISSWKEKQYEYNA